MVDVLRVIGAAGGGGSGIMCALSWACWRVGRDGRGVVVARRRWLHRQWYVYTVFEACREILSSGVGEGMEK